MLSLCSCVSKTGKFCDNCQKEADEFYNAYLKATVEEIENKFVLENEAEERLIRSYFEFDR